QGVRFTQAEDGSGRIVRGKLMIPTASSLEERYLLYRALGATMQSDFHFRDLEPVPALPSTSAPTMRIQRSGEPPACEGSLIHSTPDPETGLVRLELWESDRVLTWCVRDIGTFALSTDGRSVRYYLEADAEHGDA